MRRRIEIAAMSVKRQRKGRLRRGQGAMILQVCNTSENHMRGDRFGVVITSTKQKPMRGSSASMGFAFGE